jgi:putative DNA primase/helicase
LSDGWSDPGWGEAAREHHAQEEYNGGNGRDESEIIQLEILRLARLGEVAYEIERAAAANRLGMRTSILDKLVEAERKKSGDDRSDELPHWKVEPWDALVDGATLLADIERTFIRYIVLPKGAGVALALWILHAWTVDAGDISPFIVLVSPTKRCGKTSALIILYYLTPRSELASNISPSALFRYIEQSHPTLLIDEADSFVKDNEELRGILNSGQTKAAAHVIRNVEVNGEHKPRRFSTWAPKAIATIRSLADTLEDRAVVLTLQRKPKTAKVQRLRKRDSEEFATFRRQAARWANDNFAKLTDPDPAVPDALNDRAADNWRPLLAIADIVGADWPQRAREAACILSGGDTDGAANVELLQDIRKAFGDADAIRSADLVESLTADPERPWAEYNRGKPITQRQLARLLGGFHIISTNVRLLGQQGKGYRRSDFEGVWEAYCPGQNPSSRSDPPFYPSQRPNADEMGTTRDFLSVPESTWDGSKKADLFYSHAAWDAGTDKNPEIGPKGHFDQGGGDTAEHRCDYCGGLDRAGDPLSPWDWPRRPEGIWLHPRCEAPWRDSERGPS